MVVVVAVAKSDQTDLVREGASLADAFDDELHVIHVLDVETEDDEIGMTSQQTHERLHEIAVERASNAATGISRGVEAVGLVNTQISSSIVEYAENQDARYLVVGGRKRSPSGKAIFGSETQSVLLNATCPVLTVIQQ